MLVGVLLMGTPTLSQEIRASNGAIAPHVGNALVWSPIVLAGSNLWVGPCTNYSNASQGFSWCQMNFTTISFSTNSTAYLTGNLTAKEPFLLIVTESKWVGLEECYSTEVIGCPSPYNGTVEALYGGTSTAALPTNVNLGALLDENSSNYPLVAGDWTIVIGYSSLPPATLQLTVDTSIAYS